MPPAGDFLVVPRTVANVTTDAVEAATGRDWAGWLEYLDGVVGPDVDHPTLVAAVRNAGVDNGWWQQKIATGYEQERGGRAVGETADSGFQVGVQRTIPVDRRTLWNHLVGDGIPTWLGETTEFAPVPRVPYETADGTTGEVRTVAEGERLRTTWHPDRLDEPATLQLTLACPRNAEGRTTLRVHLENLPDATARDDLRTHWQAVLDRLQADLSRDR